MASVLSGSQSSHVSVESPPHSVENFKDVLLTSQPTFRGLLESRPLQVRAFLSCLLFSFFFSSFFSIAAFDVFSYFLITTNLQQPRLGIYIYIILKGTEHSNLLIKCLIYGGGHGMNE